MVRNIVFDIGGVLADFRLKEFLAENVEAARRIGFEGIVFTSYDALLAALEKAGVRIG